MKSAVFVSLAAMATASPEISSRQSDKPLVTYDALKADIKAENLMAGAQILQNFADLQSNGTRSIGTPGHNHTIHWIKDELDATGYYNVELQTFDVAVQLSGQINAFSIRGANVTGAIFEYSPSASVTADLVYVPNEGCEASDYPSSVDGKIGLVSRGTCDFGVKSALAGLAGAKALIIYDNKPGLVFGTLATDTHLGSYVPTIAITQELGNSTAIAIGGGANITATIDITTEILNVSSSNVIAISKTGNQDEKLSLGAHTDSVPEGPGINDNGSGTIALVEVAKALSKYSINNAVMFGFWTAEELGDLGSQHYVETLPETELAKIRAYLNFDMLATKNGVLGAYDGTSTNNIANTTFPPGSAQIQYLFTSYFNSSSLPSIVYDVAGRSDHAAFQAKGVPVGGLLSSGFDNKTEEEAKIFGGQANVPQDACYHEKCDNVENLNSDVWEIMTKGVAYAVAEYAVSWGDFPERKTGQGVGKRAVRKTKKAGRAREMVCQ